MTLREGLVLTLMILVSVVSSTASAQDTRVLVASSEGAAGSSLGLHELEWLEKIVWNGSGEVLGPSQRGFPVLLTVVRRVELDDQDLVDQLDRGLQLRTLEEINHRLVDPIVCGFRILALDVPVLVEVGGFEFDLFPTADDGKPREASRFDRGVGTAALVADDDEGGDVPVVFGSIRVDISGDPTAQDRMIAAGVPDHHVSPFGSLVEDP